MVVNFVKLDGSSIPKQQCVKYARLASTKLTIRMITQPARAAQQDLPAEVLRKNVMNALVDIFKIYSARSHASNVRQGATKSMHRRQNVNYVL